MFICGEVFDHVPDTVSKRHNITHHVNSTPGTRLVTPQKMMLFSGVGGVVCYDKQNNFKVAMLRSGLSWRRRTRV